MIYILIAFMTVSAGFIFGMLFVSKLYLIKEKQKANTCNDNNKASISRDELASNNPVLPCAHLTSSQKLYIIYNEIAIVFFYAISIHIRQHSSNDIQY